MAQKQVVFTKDAPPPLPFFSQAVICQGIVYCSGSVGMDPVTLKLVEGGVGDRARQCLQNLEAVLRAAGSKPHNIIKVTIYLTSMTDFAAVNKVYETFFNREGEVKPVRTCVAVHQLPLGTDVEIECMAHLNERAKL